MTATLQAAHDYARRGWPVLPIRNGAKTPLVAHGVRDATTDPHQLGRWFRRWPDANLAIATGLPGPTVLDVDDLQAARGLLARLQAPAAATGKGRHLYFAGQPRGTVVLGFGELRGQGSYVVAPPSIHPSGVQYTWLAAPDGPLPPVPAVVAGHGSTAGAGDHQPPDRLVPHRQRHPYLRDFAVRLARANVLDQRRMLAHLQCEFDHSCEPSPPPAPGALEAIAAWAVSSRIAHRERRGA